MQSSTGTCLHEPLNPRGWFLLKKRKILVGHFPQLKSLGLSPVQPTSKCFLVVFR